MRTKPNLDYKTPDNVDVREMAERVGLQTYSLDFAKDLANIASGGEIIPSVDWQFELAKKLPEPAVSSDSNGNKKYSYERWGETNYTLDKGYAQNYQYENAKSANESVCEYMRGLEFDKITGKTPLEKSCNLLKTIYDSNIMCEIDNPLEEHGGELLPAFIEGRGDKAANQTNYLFDTIESLDDAEKELLIDKSEFEGGKGHGDENATYKTKLAHDMVKGALTWLEVSRELEQVVRFKISKSNEKTPDLQGDDSHRRQIKSLMELGRIPAIEYALPSIYRITRAITKATQVRERVSREDKQQLIYMLIDCSASMKYGNNAINKAGGVLFNRLKSVVNEEAVMRFRFFDTELFPEHVAETPEQANSLMEKFKEGAYDGGGTSIDSCLKKTIKRVEELCADKTFSEKPEIVVVTDGEDRVKLHKSDFSRHNLRLHAFIVGGTNKILAKLARDTGGVASQEI